MLPHYYSANRSKMDEDQQVPTWECPGDPDPKRSRTDDDEEDEEDFLEEYAEAAREPTAFRGTVFIDDGQTQPIPLEIHFKVDPDMELKPVLFGILQSISGMVPELMANLPRLISTLVDNPEMTEISQHIIVNGQGADVFLYQPD